MGDKVETNINISSFWTRVWAFLIDGAILGLIGLILGLTVQDFLVKIGNYGLLFGLVITVIYQTVFNSNIFNGQTLGKRAMGIQVVDINGNTLGIDKSFIRAMILSFPYFTANLTIPGLADFNIVNVLKTVILASLVIGVVTIYIFNKGTRQSLHDLIMGSFVVILKRRETAVPPLVVTKAAYYVYGSFVILLIAVALYFSTVTNFGQNLINVFREVSEIKGVIRTNVTEGTTYSNGSKTTKYEAKVWVVTLPSNAESDSTVRKIVTAIFKNEPDIGKFDLLSIQLIRGFNIGIASKWQTKSVSKSPDGWASVVR